MNNLVIKWGVVIGASLFALISDIRSRRIPNTLTFSLLFIGLVFSLLTDGLSGLGQAFLGCLLLGVPYILLFLFAGGGAGDAKLMAAIGSWLGIKQSITALLCVSCIGMILGIIKAAVNGKLKIVLTGVFVSLYTFFIINVLFRKRPEFVEEKNVTSEADGLEMPYGIAIFAGVCIAAAVVKIWGVDWLWQLG